MAGKPTYKLYSSTVLDADPDSVWDEVRDVMKVVKIVFEGVVSSVDWTEGGSLDRVPSRYDFTLLPNDDLVRQEVAGRNEVERSLTYRTVAPALCIAHYVATYRVREVSNDPTRSYLEWSREVETVEGADPEAVDAVLGMMENQINLLRDHFARPEN
ncbi:MAG TPA: SRPBCC family protein [Actinophytocola sp.]|uniref:SRPBCC family protein n=1 Tax=Actinophytocola sp. TaxID=1872138 RepID=UPI002F934F1D